uniref:glycosyltransferase family 2 protein n=1 Tax=Flavobacterium sp. TaxID=239 RepID=UPI00404A73E3
MNNFKDIDISIVVPLYNEEDVFSKLTQRLTDVINRTEFTCEVILVNDGSSDKTNKLIEQICKHDIRFTGILLSRNHGHQLAVTAGLQYVRGKKGAMIIDGDLQDPPELVNQFYDLLITGYDVIYAVRKNRKESFIKKLAYSSYYRLQKKVSNFNIPFSTSTLAVLGSINISLKNSLALA